MNAQTHRATATAGPGVAHTVRLIASGFRMPESRP